MRINKVSLSVFLGLGVHIICTPLLAAADIAEQPPLYFNITQPVNDLVGSLAARVQFAQSQIIPSHPKEGDRQPILTSERKSLLLVQPLYADDATQIYVDVRDNSDQLLGTLTLAPPSALPKTVYHVDMPEVSVIPQHSTASNSAQAKLKEYEQQRERNRLKYAPHTWSGELPAQWIKPGLNLIVRQGDLSGELSGIKVGAPSELLLHTIDLGLLTPPRERFAFSKDHEAHREYFQTIPVSRMIVNNYAPLHLKEVMMPNGKLLTDLSPHQGSWLDGELRQYIGKELISHGINNANYGLNSSPGIGEKTSAFRVAQVTVHNSIGNYLNGKIVHGGSGGNGMATLDKSIGNEFSHEVGHNFGLVHYPDGFRGSVHRSAENINSTWGWDSDSRRFIPNFTRTKQDKDSCWSGQCQPPFEGYRFGYDAMAGGDPFSTANRFTLYTPNSAENIQHFLESKAVFDSASPTGFTKWNKDKSRMEPYVNTIPTDIHNLDMNNLGNKSIQQWLIEAPHLKISLADGSWVRNINIPFASSDNKGHKLSIEQNATWYSNVSINGNTIVLNKGQKKHYISDGTIWQEKESFNNEIAPRKPAEFGVPVTTLVGYYDPRGIMTSYIYPALHGAYGFVYPEDTTTNYNNGCHLQVDTQNGTLNYELHKTLYSSSKTGMNKFHVNIPTASQPTTAQLICRGNVLISRELAPQTTNLSYTINGINQTKDMIAADINLTSSKQEGGYINLPVAASVKLDTGRWLPKHRSDTFDKVEVPSMSTDGEKINLIYRIYGVVADDAYVTPSACRKNSIRICQNNERKLVIGFNSTDNPNVDMTKTYNSLLKLKLSKKQGNFDDAISVSLAISNQVGSPSVTF